MCCFRKEYPIMSALSENGWSAVLRHSRKGYSREALLRAVVDSVRFEQIKSKPASAGLKSEIRNILTDALIGGVAGLGFYVVMKIIKRMDRKKADGGDSFADTTAASTLRCGNCGGELPQDVKFCPHCGWKIRE